MNDQMTKETFLELAAPYGRNYQTKLDLEPIAGSIDGVVLVAASGTGKGYLAEQLAHFGYGAITGWMTRDLRRNEINGVQRWQIGYGESKSFSETLHLLERGLAVQCTFGPGNKELYGSFLEDWQAKRKSRVVFDVMPDTAREYRTFPFRSRHDFYILMDDYKTWEQQRANRNDDTDADDWVNRLVEAQSSYVDFLSDNEYIPVINDGKSKHAVEVIRNIVEHGIRDTDYERRARELGKVMLGHIEETLEKI